MNLARTLTHTLTRSLTHTLAPTLTYVMKWSSQVGAPARAGFALLATNVYMSRAAQMEPYCYYCRLGKKEWCSHCTHKRVRVRACALLSLCCADRSSQQSTDYYAMYYADYFSSFFSDYYADHFTGNPGRPGARPSRWQRPAAC
jgi:hypothetical protein